MKTNLLIILIVCLSLGQKAFAQENNGLNNCHFLEDTLQYLKKEFVESNRFIGKPAKELFQAFKSILPTGVSNDIASSPYVDPEGKSYLEGVTFYYDKNWSKKFHTRQPFIVIDIYFEKTNMRIIDFYQNVPPDKAMDYTGHYTVKKIHIYVQKYKSSQ